MILVIDNYDSFVHNLARLVRLAGAATRVVRNDAIDAAGVMALRPDGLVISPGPGTPRDAGNSISLIRELGERLPILGVCLGHQAIVEAFGGRVVRGPEPMHGHTSEAVHDGRSLFEGLPNPLVVCRYHSLVAERDSLPAALRTTAETNDAHRVLMAVEHRERPIYGMQFHPEALLTDGGQTLLQNFVNAAEASATRRD